MGDYSKLQELAEAAGLVDWKWWTSNSFLRLTTESKGRYGADGDAISAYRDSVQCPEAYRSFIEKASPAAIGELITRNKELADELTVVEFQKKILGEGLRKDRAEIDKLKAERDQLFGNSEQLKAENEALRKALREVMTQVDGNIRETVRDCVNGHNDVQDIYGYCDTIEGIVGGALLSE